MSDGSYRPGGYVEILVEEPKERLVSAAPFGGIAIVQPAELLALTTP